MCGIAGVYSFSEAGKNRLQKYTSFINPLKKRGPDADGAFHDDRVGLIHTRLSIIDTSTNASQPFTDSTGRYVLVFNGEFFNYQQHRNELQKKGIAFRSDSDTEVLLNLLITEGESAIPKINGFFAFAFYDTLQGTVILARDRFGIKPLVYFQDQDNVVFASELKSLIKSGISLEPDMASLRMFFHLNYIPGPWTVYKGVRKLEPGTFLKIGKGGVTQMTYYSASRIISSDNYETACRQLGETLEDAVKLRLVSDVPLGAFLSGGLDSSIITALAAKHKEHLNTFSIGFSDEPYFDETKYARILAKKHNTNHTEFSLKTTDLLTVLDEVLDYIDEPFADSSALAVFILSRETRRHATVALSGDGADELFAGYNKHEAELKARKLNSLRLAFRAGKPILDLLPASRNSKTGNRIRQARKFAEAVSYSQSDRYWRWAGFTPESENPVGNEKEYQLRRSALLNNLESGDFNDVLQADVRMVLAGDMLTKVDSMSMANSLEVRVPFLDYRVADLAFSMPPNFKIDGPVRKKVLRDTFGHLLTPELLNRDKKGFEVPILRWFRNELSSRLDKEVFDPSLIKKQGILNPEKVVALRKKLHSNNPGDAAAQTFAMLVFQAWHKKYMC